MLYLFQCLFWLSKVGWNPALVLSPTSVILVLLYITNVEPHLNMKHFETILMLSLYHYNTLYLPSQLSISSLVDLTCFKELVSQSSNTVLLFLASLIIKRKPAQTASWKLKQLSGLLLPPLSCVFIFYGGRPVCARQTRISSALQSLGCSFPQIFQQQINVKPCWAKHMNLWRFQSSRNASG